MDLSAVMKNLRLTRSPSPSRGGEVTLQRLPHHTKPPYEQIDTFPGEDILKRNFSDLLVVPAQQSSQDSEMRTSQISSAHPASQPEARRTIHHTPRSRPVTDPVPVPARTMQQNFDRDFSPEDERREQVLREQGLRETELLRLGRMRTNDQWGPSTGTHAGPPILLSERSHPNPERFTPPQAELIQVLPFFGVDPARATSMARLIRGSSVDEDFAALTAYVPQLGSYQCTLGYLTKVIRQVLEGGRPSDQLRNQREQQEQSTSTPSPSSVSTLIHATTPSTLSTAAAPSLVATPPPVIMSMPQPSPSRSLSSVLGTTNMTREHVVLSNDSVISPSPSLPPGSPPANRPSVNPAAVLLPMSPPTPTWGGNTWPSYITDNPSSTSPEVRAPPVPPRPMVEYPALPSLLNTVPIPMPVRPALPPLIPPPPPLPLPLTATSSTWEAPLSNMGAMLETHAPISGVQIGLSAPVTMPSGSASTRLPAAEFAHSGAPRALSLPPTPAPVSATPLRHHVKQESSTPSMMSRSASASPSTSLFRSGPHMEPIPTRGTTNAKMYMFTATSPGRVIEPPRLKPGQVPQLGDLLFNKFPSSLSNWSTAQVWMFTDANGDGNPGWEDIEECYGSLDNLIKHPREPTRFLAKHKKDGKPGWVTEATIKSYISQAAKAVDESLVN